MFTVLLYLVLGCGFAFLAYWIFGLLLVILNQLFNIKRVGPITMYPRSERFDMFVWFYWHKPLGLLLFVFQRRNCNSFYWPE